MNKNNAIGVLATVGPDLGLTAEEREVRNRRDRWQRIKAAAGQRLERIQQRIDAETSPAVLAALEIKAQAASDEIVRAEMELTDASDPAN